MLKETSTQSLQRTKKSVGKPNVCTVHPIYADARLHAELRNIKVARRVRTKGFIQNKGSRQSFLNRGSWI